MERKTTAVSWFDRTSVKIGKWVTSLLAIVMLVVLWGNSVVVATLISSLIVIWILGTLRFSIKTNQGVFTPILILVGILLMFTVGAYHFYNFKNGNYGPTITNFYLTLMVLMTIYAITNTVGSLRARANDSDVSKVEH